MGPPTRVCIIDDSARARDGLRALLATWPEISVAGEAATGRDGVQLVAECLPDVVLMDLQMPVMDGLEATRIIKQRWPTISVVVLTMYAAEPPAALAAGADAFVIKGSAPERLLTALRVVGQHPSEPPYERAHAAGQTNRARFGEVDPMTAPIDDDQASSQTMPPRPVIPLRHRRVRREHADRRAAAAVGGALRMDHDPRHPTSDEQQ